MNNTNILISIVVPVYNVENYLEKCIKSLINQTYKQLEIILVDDGSTDDSANICDFWEKKDKRIKCIHTLNHGVSHARNIGIEHARGNYIGFVDADDWIDTNMYQNMLENIELTGAEICGVGYVKEYKEKTDMIFLKKEAKVYERESILCEVFSLKNPKLLWWEVWDKLFNKELITGIRFREDITSCEDMLFFWQSMKRVSKFAYLPLYSYHYRMRESSAVHSGITENSLTRRYALDQIYKDSFYEKDQLRICIKKLYVIMQISIVKGMFLLQVSKYENDIKRRQAFIRHNIFNIFNISGASLRTKLGAICLSFPYSWIIKISALKR